MPDFTDPFSGMAPERKMTLGELTRALRLDMAAELEAIHLYESQADATDDPLAAAVLRDIANEERVHVGEFQRAISILLADEDAFLADGAEEVDVMNAAVSGQSPPAYAEPDAAEAAEQVPTIGSLRSV